MPTSLKTLTYTTFTLVALTVTLFFALQTHAQSCHLITNPNQTPGGYASPVSYFTNDLMIKADCNDDRFEVAIGNGKDTTWIYDKAYLWNGNTWKTINVFGSDKNGAWYPKEGATASLATQGAPTYFVAYTCEYVGGAWKCGCTTQTCTQNQWQLQMVTPISVSQGGGTDGGGYTGGDSDVKVCFAGSGNVKNVSNSSALSSALSNASCGDEIVVAPGTYSGTYTYSRSCSSGNPVVIRSSQPLGAVLTGRLTLSGSYGIVTNFTVKKGTITLKGDSNRVTRNLFEEWTMGVYFDQTADRNRVDHNEFRNAFKKNGTNQQSSSNILFNVRGDYPTDNRVDHNYFTNTIGAKNDDAPGNVIYLGTFSNNKDTNTLIERNLFENQPKRVFHTKTDGATFRENYIKGGMGEVDVRYGDNNRFINNRHTGSRPLILRGENVRAEGNYVESRIAVWTYGVWDPSRNGGFYIAANGAQILNNHGPLTVGTKFTSQTSDIRPVKNVTVRNHFGNIEKRSGLYDPATYSETKASTSQAPGRNLNLTTSNVGMNAPDSDCQ